MTRMSKQGKRRNQSPRRPKLGSVKTGPKKDALEAGFKEHANAINSEFSQTAFISKIK